MSMTTIGKHDIESMIAGAAAQIRENATRLSELDSFCGDGDHGTTMLRTVERLTNSIEGGSGDLKTALHEAGWNVLGADGGASSALLGTFFLGMADGAAAQLDCRGLAAMFESGLAAVRRQTKASPGDKTMIDALVPAVEQLRVSAESGCGVLDALENAAAAAGAGAESTANFTARFGRAKFLGEKTRGHPDPGAVSIALLFEGFWRGLTGTKGGSVNA